MKELATREQQKSNKRARKEQQKSNGTRLQPLRERMIVRSIGLLMVSITFTFTFAEESAPGDVLSEIGGSSVGFQGIQGKKEFASLLDEQLLKRAPMGFQGMRGKKDSIIGQVEKQLVPREADKRAPMGFQGTRGKKVGLLRNLQDSSFLYDDYEKRAPMGFQGMRGKKSFLEEEYYKRAPMGFQGMRGKKSLEEILEDIKKRRIAGRFERPLEGEAYLLDYPEELSEKRAWLTAYRGICDKNGHTPGEWEKRAPMGFQGTRGKKFILDAFEELEKRADVDTESYRGSEDKKDPFGNYLDYSISPSDYEKRAVDFEDSEGSESFKRARIGFHGMRGKRDARQIYGSNSSVARTTMGYQGGMSNRGNDLTTYEMEKRSPFRYLGTRGKKNPRWEFRGKFVGVRGKKSSSPQAVEQGRTVF